MDRELGLASYHNQRREVVEVVKDLTIILAARLLLAYETYKIYETVNVTTPVVLDAGADDATVVAGAELTAAAKYISEVRSILPG